MSVRGLGAGGKGTEQARAWDRTSAVQACRARRWARRARGARLGAAGPVLQLPRACPRPPAALLLLLTLAPFSSAGHLRRFDPAGFTRNATPDVSPSCRGRLQLPARSPHAPGGTRRAAAARPQPPCLGRGSRAPWPPPCAPPGCHVPNDCNPGLPSLQDVKRWRESEITHGRVAMLASLGFIVQEQTMVGARSCLLCCWSLPSGVFCICFCICVAGGDSSEPRHVRWPGVGWDPAQPLSAEPRCAPRAPRACGSWRLLQRLTSIPTSFPSTALQNKPFFLNDWGAVNGERWLTRAGRRRSG